MSQPKILIIDIEVGGERYKLSSDGKVFSKHGKELKQRLCAEGYPIVTLGQSPRRAYKLHRLLALNFVPNPEGLETVDHIDNDKTNNNLSNLRWLTRVANVKDAQDEPCLAEHPDGWGIYYPCQAAAKVDGHKQSNISHVLCGRRKTHHGLKWSRL